MTLWQYIIYTKGEQQIGVFRMDKQQETKKQENWPTHIPHDKWNFAYIGNIRLVILINRSRDMWHNKWITAQQQKQQMTSEHRRKRKSTSSSFQHSLTRKTFYIQHLLQFIDITEPNCKDSPAHEEPSIWVEHSPQPTPEADRIECLSYFRFAHIRLHSVLVPSCWDEGGWGCRSTDLIIHQLIHHPFRNE